MGKAQELAEKYDALAAEYPKTKLALDVLPFTNVPASAGDVASALAKEDYKGAAMNALGFIPGVKALKKVIPAAGLEKAKQVFDKAAVTKKIGRTVDAVNDTVEYAGREGYKKGGKVSLKRRGDGIAKRGRTKGRVV